MSDKPLISIIVPVYNVERYLPRCIESILRQTYTNFELILVDDGTPDRSGIICDRYAEKDSRIRVIHKENGGVSTARNAGIDAAKGEWITFVDSDDWVSDKYLQVHIDSTLEYNYDFVISSIEIRGLKTTLSLLKTEGVIYSTSNVDYVLELIAKPRFHGPFAKLYRTDILKLNEIKFPLGIKDGEDKIFVAEYLKHCRSIKTLSDVTYFYNRLNEYSVTQKFDNIDKLPSWIDQYLKNFSDICDIYGAEKSVKEKILSDITVSHLYPYLRNCAKDLKPREAKKTFINASIVLLPWVSTNYTSKNEQVNKVIRALFENNFTVAYKLCRRYAFLRKIKQFKRVAGIKLQGRFLERKRDGITK